MTMTTMTNPNRNGRKRASLDEQINRLDETLDGLADGLNEAVADAVKMTVGNAVREAVQGVLTQVLTNPDVLAKIRATAGLDAEPSRKVTVWQRVRNCLANLRQACSDYAQTLRTAAGQIRDWTCDQLAALWVICQMLSPFKYHVITALAIGTLVGVGVWCAGPWLGIFASGVGGFATTLSIQAGLWLRKLFASHSEEMA